LSNAGVAEEPEEVNLHLQFMAVAVALVEHILLKP
jgi:hypothetical protein